MNTRDRNQANSVQKPSRRRVCNNATPLSYYASSVSCRLQTRNIAIISLH